MKISSPTYSIVTNACLISAVVSAIRYEGTSNAIWLTFGGCSALISITTYFIRHWHLEPRTRLSRSALSRESETEVVCEDIDEFLPDRLRAYYNSLASPRIVSYPSSKDWPLRSSGLKLHQNPGTPTRDPAEQVSRIVKRLQTTGKRRTYTAAFAPDGHVTLKFADVAEDPHSSSAQPFGVQMPGTVQ